MRTDNALNANQLEFHKRINELGRLLHYLDEWNIDSVNSPKNELLKLNSTLFKKAIEQGRLTVPGQPLTNFTLAT